MGDLLPRILIAGAGATCVIAVAVVGRRWERHRARVAPLRLDGIDGRVVFFTDASCKRCELVRSMLEASGVTFTEYPYDEDPEVHRAVGVTGVPLVVIRDAAGQPVDRLAGVPTPRRLSRLLAAAS